jgi:acetyl-CoA acetyltransferase
MSTRNTMRGSAAIVGVADAVSPTGELGGQVRGWEVAMAREALADAGLTLADVDGVFSCTGGTLMHSVELAEHLGIQPRWTDSTNTGGSAFEVHVEHAAAAIHLGLCDVALIVYAGLPRSSRGGIGPLHTGPRVEWELPYGIMLPTGAYALAASRHMAVYGTRPEHLAQVAVSTRQWAQKNERARLRSPLTLEEAMASPVLASPLRKVDCCLITDGAGAIVLTSAARARALRRPPIYVLGAASAHSHSSITQMPDLTQTCAVDTGRRAFAMADVTAKDVDVAEIYDAFTISVLIALEDLGFCKKGEGGEFVASGALGPGGALPAQTSGGGLSYTHPGMFGIFLLVEAVRQLRGDCGARQVGGAKIALAHGCGGVLSTASTIVLGTEETL